MKHRLKFLLQKLLGFDRYLFLFSLFKILTLKWDSDENQIFDFLKMLPEPCLILDVGANIGITTAIMARAKPSSEIISFEPMPANIVALRKIIAFLNLKYVSLYELALGDREGMVKMLMPVQENVKLQGLSHVVEDAVDEKKGILVEVPLRTLDSFDFGKSVAGIKIDVENFEFQVLKGAESLIRKDRPIVYCELWEDDQREKTIAYLMNLGYKVYIKHRRKLVPCRNYHQIGSRNYFFLPDHKQL